MTSYPLLPYSFASSCNAWLLALDQATSVLHGRTTKSELGRVRRSLQYCYELENVLQQHHTQESDWDLVPRIKPPKFSEGKSKKKQRTRGRKNTNDNKKQDMTEEGEDAPCRFEHNSPTTATTKHSSAPAESALKNNPYASIAYDSDDDDDDDHKDKDKDKKTLCNKQASGSGGNHDLVKERSGCDLTPTTTESFTDPSSTIVLSARHVWIRIKSAQADLLSIMAKMCRNTCQWQQGALYCTKAVRVIHQALMSADAQVSRYLQSWNTMSIHPSAHETYQQVQSLMEDADIVSVSVQQFMEEQDRFLKSVQKQEANLRAYLERQRQAREEIKNRLGDRWYNNPNPKTYRSRRDEERELKELEFALEKLAALDTGGLLQTTQEIKYRLTTEAVVMSPPPPPPLLLPQLEPHTLDSSYLGRYNSFRPMDMSNRVSMVDYPDPTEFGWFCTGSNEMAQVEYFERDGILLDWYYTNASVKTFFDHNGQGQSQLYASKPYMKPEMYRRVLETPGQLTKLSG